MENPRRFRLIRDRDVSGVSGTGLVAFGVQFPDGTCVTRWDAAVAQTCVWDSIENVEQVHGHGGATRVEWLDEGPFCSCGDTGWVEDEGWSQPEPRSPVERRPWEGLVPCGFCNHDGEREWEGWDRPK